MKFLLPVLFFSCTFCCAYSLPETGIDIRHYTFEINLNDSTDAISAIATLEINITKPIESFNLDLTDIKAGKGMLVKEVSAFGKVLKFTHNNNRLTIVLSQELKSVSIISIKIVYSGIPEDGLIIGQNKYGDRTFFGDNWPDRAHHWLPVVDHPADKAGVDFIVTAPPHYEVIGNGIKLEESFIDQKRKLTHWREETPISTKVMVIGAARFAIQYAAIVDDISVQQWVYPQDRNNGFSDYSAAAKILSFFIQHIGPYPYQKLANVQSKTTYGGMENASNIFYFENSVNGKADQDDLIAHEIAHQWFGNSASESDWHHVWLSEGFATYFSHLYNEYTYGRDKRAADMANDRKAIFAHYAKNPLPVVFNTLPTKLLDILSPNSYEKGSWILHMLRNEVGEKAFWDGIQRYYKMYKNSNASTTDFQTIMEAASGKKLDTFFKQWLYTAGHPVLDCTWKYNEGTLEITVAQTQNQVFQFPLEFGIYSGVDMLPVIEERQIDQKSKKFSLKMAQKPVKVVLDPNVNLLFDGKFRN